MTLSEPAPSLLLGAFYSPTLRLTLATTATVLPRRLGTLYAGTTRKPSPLALTLTLMRTANPNSNPDVHHLSLTLTLNPH